MPSLVIVDASFFTYCVDKQTDKQTLVKSYPLPTAIGVGNDTYYNMSMIQASTHLHIAS